MYSSTEQRYTRNNFTGDFDILQKIVLFIINKGYDIEGKIVHVGGNKYEISYSYCSDCFMEATWYTGLFWIENGEVKNRSVETWMS